MKGIFWVVIVGVIFWWMAVSSTSRDAVFRGTRYAIARIAGALGLEFGKTPPARPPEELPERETAPKKAK